jgi:acyl-coenzyme A synthetase/AMP-(fatty) acid ligase
VPARVVFRDTIPTTIMGKVDRRAVLAEIDERIRELGEAGGEPQETPRSD